MSGLTIFLILGEKFGNDKIDNLVSLTRKKEFWLTVASTPAELILNNARD